MTIVINNPKFKYTKEPLWKSDNLIRELFNSNPIPTFIWQKVEEDFILRDINDAAVTITQNNSTYFVGNKASEIYKDIPEIFEALFSCFIEKTFIERDIFSRFENTGENKYLAFKYAFVPPDLVLVHTEDITNLRQTKEALRKDENKYRNLADLLPQTVFEIDSKFNLIFSNYHGFQSFGYTQKDMDKGLNALQLFIPEDRDRGKRNIQKIINGEKSRGNEYTALRKDGSTFPVIIYSSSIIHNGKPVGLRGIVIDITERKQTEETLRNNEEMMCALINATTDSVILIDNKFTILALNEIAAQRFGKSIGELVGLNIKDLAQDSIAPTIIKSNLENIDQVIRTGKPIHFEEKYKGKIFDINIYPSFDAQGKVSRLAIFSRNITDHKRTEKELQDSKRRYQVLYEENPSMYFTVDTEATVLSVNRFGAEQLGYRIEELVGRSVFDVFYEDDRKDVQQQLVTCLQNPMQVNHWEFRKVRKDGTILWVRETARAIQNADDSLVILIVCEDISERIRTQNEKEKLIKQLAEAEKMIILGQFTAAIAHEINNPLDIMLTKIYLLQNSLSKDNQNLELWDHIFRIKQQAFKMSNLAKDILNYVRPCSTGVRPVDINTILLQAIDSIYDYFSDTISIVTHLRPNLALVQGDAIGLELVFKNLILNAIQSLLQEGKIIVSTKMLNKKVLEITIKDNGKGISDEDLTKIFDPFFTIRRKSGGVGLGLTICKKIIEEHNGMIKIESKSSKGTLVTIHLFVK